MIFPERTPEQALFDHAEAGQPESAWLMQPHWGTLPSLHLEDLAVAYRTVLVLSAHPDDETLGVGALIAALGRHGASVTIVVATAGEHSHPDATAWTPAELARQRRQEVERAVADLGAQGGVRHVGLPDGSLTAHEQALVDELAAMIKPGTLVLAPWFADGHPDHDAAGRAARAAAQRAGATVLHYPIWLWHWCPPEQAPWQHLWMVEPTIEDLKRKRTALGRFSSQTDPLGPGPGDRPVVTEAVLARAHRLVEVLIDPDQSVLPTADAESTESMEATRAATFDAMYDGGDDPWRFENSFYEERKRHLIMAVLGRKRYSRVLEVGCATGHLTRALTVRADHVTAFDASTRALAVARRRTAARTDGAAGSVTWLHGHAPGVLPAGPFELVVLSEIGYFLTPRELLATLRRVRSALAADGEIVLGHWQHPTSGIPLNGAFVHTQAGAVFDLPHRAHYADADVRIDVWGTPLSVAEAEGRR